MRTRFSLLAFGLVLATVACGTNTTTPEGAATTSTPASGQAEPSPEPDTGDDGRETVSIVDDAGRVIDLQVPVREQITFNARNMEFVRAVGAIDTAVAMSDSDAQQTDYWPELDTSMTVGNQSEPNWEEIASLAPEVVIFPRNGAWQEAIERLEPFGIKVVVLTGWDPAKHEVNVSTLGLMFDKREEAERVNEFYLRYKNLLAERLADVEPKPLYLENSSGDFVSPIPGSGWHEMIVTAGGKNIFEDVLITDEPGSGASAGSVHAFPIDPEAVVEREPATVVKLSPYTYAAPDPEQLDETLAELVARPVWSALGAVQSGNVHVLSAFPANACSKIIGALYVAKWLHPDVFSDIDPDEAHREWTEDFQGVPLEDPTEYYASAA